MRRQDMHTGDLVAWSPYRTGRCHPGIIFGPIPAYLNDGKYRVYERGSTYLLLITRQDGDIQKIIENRADQGATEPGADFWGVGTHVRDFVYEAWESRADGVPSRVTPDSWRWSLINSSSIRGAYVPHRAEDVRRNEAALACAAVEEEGRKANEERLERVRTRLVAADLDPEQVDFISDNPTKPDPTVRLPIGYLEMLLDDREH